MPENDLGDPSLVGDEVDAISRRFVVFLVVACLLGTVVNVAMQANAPASLRGIRGHDDGTLSRLITEEQPGVRVRYLFPAVLRENVSGTLVVPDGELVGRFMIRNLARMRLEVSDYDPQIDAASAERFRGLGVEGQGSLRTGGESHTFVVVADPSRRPGRHVLLFHGDIAFVVPEAMAQGARS